MNKNKLLLAGMPIGIVLARRGCYYDPVSAALVVTAGAAVAGVATSIKAQKAQEREAQAEEQRQAKLEVKAQAQEKAQAAVQAQEATVTRADRVRANIEKERRASLTGSSLLTGGDTGLMKSKLGS